MESLCNEELMTVNGGNVPSAFYMDNDVIRANGRGYLVPLALFLLDLWLGFLTNIRSEMETLTKIELVEINGGVNQDAYNAGHAAGDFVQMIVRGVLLLSVLLLE